MSCSPSGQSQNCSPTMMRSIALSSTKLANWSKERKKPRILRPSRSCTSNFLSSSSASALPGSGTSRSSSMRPSVRASVREPVSTSP
eukprot:364447-Chlamydomonas_euryale.AAC.26